MALQQLSDTSFKKEVLESAQLVLVDFWATWCGPCKMIAPALEDLAREYDGKMIIGKVDVDSNPKTPNQYGIMSIPTLMFFKNGQVIEQLVGMLNKAQIKKKIDEHLR